MAAAKDSMPGDGRSRSARKDSFEDSRADDPADRDSKCCQNGEERTQTGVCRIIRRRSGFLIAMKK